MINVISQSLELDLVNINVYAKVHQTIPNGYRHFSLFSGDKIFINCPMIKSSQTVQ